MAGGLCLIRWFLSNLTFDPKEAESLPLLVLFKGSVLGQHKNLVLSSTYRRLFPLLCHHVLLCYQVPRIESWVGKQFLIPQIVNCRTMSTTDLNWIANYIWGIADDVLRDLYVRGKYRDVILPMTVLRRLDAVLEDSKQAVLDMKAALDAAEVVEQDPALRQAAGQAFYNTSQFTLRDLRARANRQQLTADFEDYLNGFSPNVQDSSTTSSSATRFRACPKPTPWAR